MQWYEAVDAALQTARKDPCNAGAKPSKLDSTEAMKIISNASSKPTVHVGVNQADPLVQSGWVRGGDRVSVTPNDTGKVPQVGILVGLSDEVVSLRILIPGMEGKSVMGHFPRIGYTIRNDVSRTKL
jgi:hypothetical protein